MANPTENELREHINFWLATEANSITEPVLDDTTFSGIAIACNMVHDRSLDTDPTLDTARDLARDVALIADLWHSQIEQPQMRPTEKDRATIQTALFWLADQVEPPQAPPEPTTDEQFLENLKTNVEAILTDLRNKIPAKTWNRLESLLPPERPATSASSNPPDLPHN